MAVSAPVFAALGDPIRLDIIVKLSDGPLPTVDLTEMASVSRQAVSKHLRVLEDVGLIRSERLGRDRVWSLEADRLAEVHKYLGEISARWDEAIGRLRSFVEAK